LFWGSFLETIREPKYIELVYTFLMQYDLSNYSPTRVLDTEEKRHMKYEANAVGEMVRDIISGDRVVWEDIETYAKKSIETVRITGELTIQISLLYTVYNIYYEKNGYNTYKFDLRKFGKEVRKMLGKEKYIDKKIKGIRYILMKFDVSQFEE